MPAVQSDPLCALGVIDPRWTGVTYARFHLPFSRLAERGISLRTLDQGLRLVEGPDGLQPEASLLDGADLLVFPQAIAAPALPGGRPLLLAEPLCALARERGIPVIHSIDDYLPELESHRPAYETLREAAPNLAALLREADAFIVTTAALQASLRGRGKPVHLLPNTIDLERW